MRNLFGNWPKLVWVFKRFRVFLCAIGLRSPNNHDIICTCLNRFRFDWMADCRPVLCNSAEIARKKGNDSAASKSDKSKSIAQFKLKTHTHTYIYTPIVVCPMKYGYIRIICYLFFRSRSFLFTLESFSPFLLLQFIFRFDHLFFYFFIWCSFGRLNIFRRFNFAYRWSSARFCTVCCCFLRWNILYIYLLLFVIFPDGINEFAGCGMFLAV